MRIVCLLAALALAGCSNKTETLTPAPGTAPLAFEDMKQLVLTNRSRIWKDPGSIRDPQIGQPFSCVGGLIHLAAMPDVCVCVEANAKNAFGGYVGIKQNEILISGRQIVDILPPRSAFSDRCGPMTPFPELIEGYTPPAARPTTGKRT